MNSFLKIREVSAKHTMNGPGIRLCFMSPDPIHTST